MLAAQGILTYCTKRDLPYHLYADGCVLFVFGAFLTSARVWKILSRQAGVNRFLFALLLFSLYSFCLFVV